ncbi:MAG: hypothetical protein ACPLRH_06210 [Desulfotomaculales bacterium]
MTNKGQKPPGSGPMQQKQPQTRQQQAQQVQPKQQSQPQPKPKIQETEDWDARLLKEARYFTVVLLDGEKIKAKLLEINKYHMQLETENGILLVPKHTVKYFILKEFAAAEE